MFTTFVALFLDLVKAHQAIAAFLGIRTNMKE